MSKFISKLVLIFIILQPFIANAQNQVEPMKYLEASDKFRGGFAQGIQWNVDLKSIDDEVESNKSFLVKAKGDKAIVDTLKPTRNKGEIYLFNDRSMWFYKPSLKKPVSISSREKMSGQAANGDIASTHYARDYNPAYEKTIQLNGKNVVVLFLTAKNKQVTYDKIRYFLDEKTKIALKAEFLTLQGEIFKSAEFEYNNKIKDESGQMITFISKMTITDAKNKTNQSVMTYSNAMAQSISDNLFNINNLSR